MTQVKHHFFLFTPLIFLDHGIQVIVPPFTALFANAPIQVLRNCCPLNGAILTHQLEHGPVFFLRPGALDEARVEHFLPAMETLDISAAGEVFGNLFPVFLVIASDGIG